MRLLTASGASDTEGEFNRYIDVSNDCVIFYKYSYVFTMASPVVNETSDPSTFAVIFITSTLNA